MPGLSSAPSYSVRVGGVTRVGPMLCVRLRWRRGLLGSSRSLSPGGRLLTPGSKVFVSPMRQSPQQVCTLQLSMHTPAHSAHTPLSMV